MIFIPFNEPWRTAYIESFNSRFNERLQLFQKFKNKHNDYQEYMKGQFSKQPLCSYITRFSPENFQYDLLTELPITNGKIHFIRLVNEKSYINIFNENFYISKELSFEYVWTTIFTKKQELKFFHKETKESDWTRLKTVEYNLERLLKIVFLVVILAKVCTMS